MLTIGSYFKFKNTSNPRVLAVMNLIIEFYFIKPMVLLTYNMVHFTILLLIGITVNIDLLVIIV